MSATGPLVPLGRILLVAAAVLALLGILLIWGHRIPWLGRLPGDFVIRRKSFTFYAPLATSLLLSILFSFLLWLFHR